MAPPVSSVALAAPQLDVTGCRGLSDSPTTGNVRLAVMWHVGSRVYRRAARVGAGVPPAPSGGLPLHSLLSCVAVLVPRKPAGEGKI